MKRLGVLVDGAPLPEAEAHAFWDRFSLYMEEHRGDLAGFAVQEGFASVHPGVDGDRPVLRASKSAPQKAYAPVKGDERNDHNDLRGPGGSPKAQGGAPQPGQRRKKHRDSAKKSAG